MSVSEVIELIEDTILELGHPLTLSDVIEELLRGGYAVEFILCYHDMAELVVNDVSVYMEYWDDFDWQIDQNIHDHCHEYLSMDVAI